MKQEGLAHTGYGEGVWQRWSFKPPGFFFLSPSLSREPRRILILQFFFFSFLEVTWPLNDFASLLAASSVFFPLVRSWCALLFLPTS